MRITVRFPVRNVVHLDSAAWPVPHGGKTLLLETEGRRVVSVGIRKSGQPTISAPHFIHRSTKGVKTELRIRGEDEREAESDLRAWRSLLMPYVLFDLDFDSPRLEYDQETEDEKRLIPVQQFSRTSKGRRDYNSVESIIIARAFLDMERGRSAVDFMTFFGDALRAQEAGRHIDAYNSFYLFLETQFLRGASATVEATARLCRSPDFTESLDRVLEEVRQGPDSQRPAHLDLSGWRDPPHASIRSLVQLRGRLRHHTPAGPQRWNPSRQDEFAREAMFIGRVAFEIAFLKTASGLWDEKLSISALELARAAGMSITVQVRITLRDEEGARDVGFEITMPQRDPTVKLAKAVLEQALVLFDEKSPGAELLSIRAMIRDATAELFRYELGAGIGR